MPAIAVQNFYLDMLSRFFFLLRSTLHMQLLCFWVSYLVSYLTDMRFCPSVSVIRAS